MSNLIKNITIISLFNLFNLFNSQYIGVPGSQTDGHGCVLDGGYEWCESTQMCQRPWETNCESTQCPDECPPPTPCPRPMVQIGCQYIQPLPDNCGCSSGCGTIDCSTHPTVTEGGTCGGFTPYGMTGICDDGLECVYSMGPMIADAPGNCQKACETVRDSWGNCVEKGCNSWYDGCNTCIIENDILTCTEKVCFLKTEDGHCLDNSITEIPKNCITWYDGCNTCSAHNGELQGCTLMMCFTTNEPYCQSFTSGELNVGEICYRFCEDGSQNTISREDDCMDGTKCGGRLTSTSMISFDSCGKNSHTCNIVSH